jgi:hypothetical protein
MTYFIFHFSYLDKLKIKEIKNSFLFNSLSDSYSLNFLTKKNFNSFFDKKFNSLKYILSGKYLIFSCKKKNINLSELLESLKLLKKFLNSFEEEIQLFNIIYNENYYFNDFLIESSKYKKTNLIMFININKHYFISSLLLINFYNYYLNFSRINNLNLLIKKDNFLSYKY